MGEVFLIKKSQRENSPAFSFDGDFEMINEDGKNWEAKIKSSGTLIGQRDGLIDVFLVGGGSGGYRGGGAGGYTMTATRIPIARGAEYVVTIGAGGRRQAAGGATSAFGFTANGGKAPSSYFGGTGGSGGGAGSSGNLYGAGGGSDGNNGSRSGDYEGGSGQGYTTRAFGEADGELFAGGGGGRGTTYGSSGGAGGGASTGKSAAANTGGGGGSDNPNKSDAGAGGSGIVIIRNTRY